MDAHGIIIQSDAVSFLGNAKRVTKAGDANAPQSDAFSVP
jgi:hypothetical protein